MPLALDTPLLALPGVNPGFLKRLRNLGLKTARDLIWHFPTRYEDFSKIYKIAELEPGQQATIQGIVEEIGTRRTWRKHMTIVEAFIADDTGSIRAVWFNQPYVANVLRQGRLVNFSGRVSLSEDGEMYLSHPAYETVAAGNKKQETKHTARLVPVYPETRGLTSKGLRYLVQPILKNLEQLPEWLPEETLSENNFPEINRALSDIHFPDNIDDALLAQKRFSFEGLFLLQLANLRQKLKLAQEKAPVIKTDIEHIKQILKELPFELTLSQKKSLWEIMQDMKRGRPMNRLLQGDVGSGKTVIAVLAALSAAEKGHQTAFMAPTEILARQHFHTVKKLFSYIKTADQPRVCLLTSSEAKILYPDDMESDIKKQDLIKKIRDGESGIVIGTHALIQKDVSFNNLALVIIDEQHRFGVRQRQELMRGRTRTENDESVDKLLYKDLTYKIRGCILNVKNALGAGHRENIYQKAIAEELERAGINFVREKILDIKYRGKKLGIYKPDFVVENKVIVELKALPLIGAVEKRQIWKYLNGSECKLALLVNFYGRGVNIDRIVYETARESPRQSAFMTPHLLSMSATPIPRTLMLTVFGDLDISLISEMPAGRKGIITKIISPDKRSDAYEFIRKEVRTGRQVFVICPRINADTRGQEQNETNNLGPRQSAVFETRAVKEEYEKLSQKIFPDLRLAMLHGKLKPREKEKTMREFAEAKTDILVSTSVVEVGVDISNATIMMIEGSDRFGLAQLYQFRGRVGRGEHQSYCLLFTDSSSKTTALRLKAIAEAKNGFELAEMDLKLRGPGEFLGGAQSGFPDIAMESLNNPELVKSAREAAIEILRTDAPLKNHPLLKEKLAEFREKLHLE